MQQHAACCQTASVTDDSLFDMDAMEAPVPAAQDSRAGAMRRVRNTFRAHPAPREPMSRAKAGWRAQDLRSVVVPNELAAIAQWFDEQPPARDRFRWVLRDSLDELLDGQRTGRWCYQHLSKTEKTYLGTAVEVNLTKEFDIPNGDDLDWQVAGIDVDCKFSKDLGGWEIPMEMYLCADHGERSGDADHPALLVWMNDDRSQWAAGLITITDDRLRWRADRDTGERSRAYNRDNKRRLADEAAPLVHWLWGGLQTDLPSNLLLQLSDAARGRILAGASGQHRVNQLFRELPGRVLGRRVILTVGQQDDAPKRARDARIHLRPEGIAVLGHQDSHPAIARALGLPVSIKGEWVSVRLARIDDSDPRPSIVLGGSRWGRAAPDEPSEAIPLLPSSYGE